MRQGRKGKNMKREIIVLTASSLLIGSLGFVGAQGAQTQSTQSGGAGTQTQSPAASQTQTSPAQRLRGLGGNFKHGFGDGDDFGRGFGGLPFGRNLALGTTLTLEFYAGDPSTASGGASTPTQTLNFTYGQDSEAAFAQSFAEARANAGYMTVNVGEQTQTLELPSSDTSTDTSNTDTANSDRGDRHGGVYGALPLRGLNEGSSVTATFYDGDPSGNAQTLQTLNFTYGQDSEAGFANDFANAAQNAAYVTITTSPQTTTVNLSKTTSGRGDNMRGGFGDRAYHRDGPGGRR